MTVCKQCEEGHYCPDSASTPLPCPAMRYADAPNNYETGERSPHGMLATNTPVETMRSDTGVKLSEFCTATSLVGESAKGSMRKISLQGRQRER